MKIETLIVEPRNGKKIATLVRRDGNLFIHYKGKFFEASHFIKGKLADVNHQNINQMFNTNDLRDVVAIKQIILRAREEKFN